MVLIDVKRVRIDIGADPIDTHHRIRLLLVDKPAYEIAKNEPTGSGDKYFLSIYQNLSSLIKVVTCVTSVYILVDSVSTFPLSK